MNRKKRINDDFWSFNFKDIFRSFEEELNALMRSGSSERSENGPITYGYSVRIGPDTNYQPEVRQWGNLNDFRRKQGLPELEIPIAKLSEPQLPMASTSNERFVDFIDEDSHLKVIVEVPGFTKDTLVIDIDEDGSEITLTGTSESKELNETIKLPSKLEVKTIKSSVNNGVLEIRGKKIKNSSQKFRVKID
ncbi:MAG: Hsp20/alpha crystallin family protein [Candidatus Heimdallarchaeota archaeon]|nr:MAG: Hsp20/alpha crystallin family protein [Candidatus Heimdallarchaeota archaeon]